MTDNQLTELKKGLRLGSPTEAEKKEVKVGLLTSRPQKEIHKQQPLNHQVYSARSNRASPEM